VNRDFTPPDSPLFFSLSLNLQAAGASERPGGVLPMMLVAVSSFLPCDYLLVAFGQQQGESLACLIEQREPGGASRLDEVAPYAFRSYYAGVQLMLQARQVHWASLDQHEQFREPARDPQIWAPLVPSERGRSAWSRYMAANPGTGQAILSLARQIAERTAGTPAPEPASPPPSEAST
jgi:hypothetical protein